MSEWAPKWFWTNSEVIETPEGLAVALDGRIIKTPAKATLALPTRAMAEAVAAEWQAQVEKVDPFSMPVTRSANAALDKVRPQQAEVVRMLADYGDSDLLCYRADKPMELVARQAAAWDPLLDWAAERLDARLEPRTGVMHIAQSDAALRNLEALVQKQDAFQLAAFHDLVSLSGSLVLAFAAIHQHRPPEQIWELSRLDEAWQEELWGVDEEAQETALRKKNAFLHAYRFFLLATSH